SDLDQVTISEKLDPQVRTATGGTILIIRASRGAGFQSAVEGDAPQDRNAATFMVPKNLVNNDVDKAKIFAAQSYRLLIDKKVDGVPQNEQGPGKGEVLQYFLFADKRTGLLESAP